MKCPKCKKEISYVKVYSEIWQKGYLNEVGKIEAYGNFQEPLDEAVSMECPECSCELTVDEK